MVLRLEIYTACPNSVNWQENFRRRKLKRTPARRNRFRRQILNFLSQPHLDILGEEDPQDGEEMEKEVEPNDLHEDNKATNDNPAQNIV